MAPDSLLEVVVSETLEMTNRQLMHVHGHTIMELELLLQDACDLFDEVVKLESNALGGWSNINIRGHSDEIDFVLKLPSTISSHSIQPYKKLYNICLFLNHHGIAPQPLSFGRLSDSAETPFIIFEYVRGHIHETLAEFSSNEIEALKECLQILAQQKPPGFKRYNSASDYLLTAHALVENHEGFHKSSQELHDLINSFVRLYPEVLSYTNSLDEWSQSLMHGDLWVPNIVLQSGKVILLDFENASYGCQQYDIAYLFEAPSNTPEEQPLGLLSPHEVDEVNSLRPLALAYIIEWSLERLLSVESKLIEPNLATRDSWLAVVGYTRSKISRLKSLLL